MLYAEPLNPPLIRQLLRINISLMVCIEFIQNAMIAFASSYLCGGLGMSRHTYSLATAIYAGTAIIMIAQHHWLVSHFGYRRFIRYSLLFFAAGALICASADDAPMYIFGRLIQAIGGSAFFTAARVHVNFFPATPAGRGLAIRYMAYSLVGCAALSAVWAAELLTYFNWRVLFLIQLPQLALVWWLSGKTISNVRKQRRTGKLHPGSMFSLVAGVFALQYVIENAPYDFSQNMLLLSVLGLALFGLSAFVWIELRRHRSLMSFRHLFSSRYLMGLLYYAICYLLLSSINYLVPIFLESGLAFPILNCGALLSITGVVALPFAWLHLKVMPKFPRQKYYLVFAFACLSLFGFLSSRLTPANGLWDMAFPLLLLTGFTAVGQGTAAFNTFRETDNRIFSQAYQTKNMLRELMNSTGVSLTNVVLQTRNALHYTRIAESLGNHALAGTSLMLGSTLSTSQWVNMATQQALVMSCLDIFFGVGCIGLIILAFSLVQRKLV